MIDTGCERRSPTMANRRGDPPILQLCLGLYSFVFGLACISIVLSLLFIKFITLRTETNDGIHKA